MDKLKFDDFLQEMSVFINIPTVERAFNESSVSELVLGTGSMSDISDEQILFQYLSVDRVPEFKSKLQVLFTTSNGSMELLYNVLLVITGRVSLSNILRNKNELKRLSEFLVNPDVFSDEIPEFSRNRFRMESDWREILSDELRIRTALSKSGQKLADYSVHVGLGLEGVVLDTIKLTNWSTEKGKCPIINNKEVDIAIPSLKDPRALVFCSYQLTSASSMTTKAGEQQKLYNTLGDYNRSRERLKKDDVLFINVIDGGGWIRRKGDLRVMHASCDYCFTFKSLERLKELFNRLKDE